MKKALPILDLDNLQIAKPCHAVWEQMTPVDEAGGERVRHCGSCDKNVYRVAGMSRAEVTALIVAKEGQVCLRMAKRSDGSLITNDCPVGVAAWRKKMAKVGAAAAAAFAAIFAFASRTMTTMGEPMPTVGVVATPTMPVTPLVVEPAEHPVLMGAPLPPPKPHPVEKMGKIAPRPETMGAVAPPKPHPEVHGRIGPATKRVAVPEPDETMGDIMPTKFEGVAS
jgi:hypothetical protein